MQTHHVTYLLEKTLLFVFAHAFTKDLLLLQPALEAVQQLLEVTNAFRLLLNDELKLLHVSVYK